MKHLLKYLLAAAALLLWGQAMIWMSSGRTWRGKKCLTWK